MRRALIIVAASVGLCAAVAGLLAAMIVTTDRALPYHFPRGVEACFGRVYDDEAFLKAHPKHRLAELYVYRDFSTGGPREDTRPRAVQIAADRASPDDLSMTVMARFRDKPGAYDRGVACSSDGLMGTTCSADCEGALFDIHPDGRGLVIGRTSPASFVNLHGAGRLRLKTDGADDRLDPMPIEACLAAYDHAADSN
jgi:hypothetical protein